MEKLNDWWGANEHITVPEMAARAAVMFLLTLVMIRATGMRPFGKNDPFDIITVFLIGGVLSRGIVGATPFIPALAGGFVLILVHKLLSWSSFNFRIIERVIKGKRMLLYSNGSFDSETMQQVTLTQDDILEQLRQNLNTDSLLDIREIFLEKNGKISFIKK
jgi:uncharacterized membrane protein YcaP (DUF421 family)